MKGTQDISRAIRQLHVPASPRLGERIHTKIAQGTPAPSVPSGPELTLGQIITLFMKKKSIAYTFATTLGLVLLGVLVLHHSSTSAWAMEQAIQALKKYKAIHLTGYLDNDPTPVDVWARSDATGNLVETGLARAGNLTIWTKDNQTYVYDHAQNTVLVEPGINFDLNFCFSPKLLAIIAKIKDYQAVEGEDPATGQRRVIVTCSIVNPAGPQSFFMEFDARSKLLIKAKAWPNLKQEGAPRFDVEEVVYFEDVPDSAFSFQPPAGATITNMPLSIPDANLSLLSDPKTGISVEGMTQEQACRKILEQLWAAGMKGDLARIHELWPVTATWSDELFSGLGAEDKIEQVLKIGGIERTGRSKLGPLAQVPNLIRYQDGSVRGVWMIVQFRETDHGTSCVVYGPHGYALNVKK